MRTHLQSGASLIVVLLLLVVVLSLGVSAAQMALQGERASRNDRDRQIAFQAAEAGLIDAEQDIEQAADTKGPRRAFFASDNVLGFVDGCGNDEDNLGLCALDETSPAWQTVDFMDQTSAARSVPYGHFTGQLLQVGHGSLPGRLPRYIVERMGDSTPGTSAGQEERSPIYRITAIGFGARDTTQVVLQTMYKKAGQ
jgi:Tfp pilus assembly protein PilX